MKETYIKRVYVLYHLSEVKPHHTDMNNNSPWRTHI